MTAPGILQVCSQCSSRWPVALGPDGPIPARWCPRCQGALLSPVSALALEQSPAPQHQAPRATVLPPAPQPPAPQPPVPQPSAPRPRSRADLPRGYRWVARMPAPPAGSEPVDNHPRPLGPTPRYRQTPRWGLPVGPAPVLAGPESREPRYLSWAFGARSTMRMLVWILGVAAAAEAFRYGLLVWNQSHLVSGIVVALSDALSIVLGVLAPVAVLLAAVGAVSWLVRTRAERYARAGWRDPRSTRSMFLGGLIPGYNLVLPGVYLTELALLDGESRGDAVGPGLPPAGTAPDREDGRSGLREFGDKFRRTLDGLSDLWLARCWWGMWVLTNVTVVGVVLARFDTSMQGRANGVFFTLYAYLLAMAVAGLTIKVMARFDGDDHARREEPARWVIAS